MISTSDASQALQMPERRSDSTASPPAPERAASRMVNLGLCGCGLAEFLLCLLSVRVQAQHDIYGEPYPVIGLLLVLAAPYLLACWLIWRSPPARSTLAIALVFAAAFRVVALCAPPALSTDLYRYIWDGRVQAAGINPYRYAPADPALAHLRDDAIYPEINRAESFRSMYPPASEALFFLTTRVSESVGWMKLTMAIVEASAMLALAALLRSHGLAAQRLLCYAWHPLTLWEFAGSGHVDVLVVASILLALWCFRCGRRAGTGAALAAATLSKLFPVVLFPALWRRGDWRMPVALAAVGLAGYLPYLLTVGSPPDASSPASSLVWKTRMVLGSVDKYSQEEQLTSGERFYLLRMARRVLPPATASAVFAGIALLAMGGVALRALLRPDSGDGLSYLRRAFALATVFIVLLSPGYPWYFCWLVPFLCFVPAPAVFWITLTACLLYANWLQSLFTLNSCIFLPAAALWLAGAVRQRLARVTEGAKSSAA